MQVSQIISTASMTLLIAFSAISVSAANHDHETVASHPEMHAPAELPRTIAGRVVAVRRVAQVISVQTADGEVHQVKVPSNASILGHNGNHFSNVKSGQSVHVVTVHDPAQGTMARSVSIP
ncbi:MAG TPA: hypothetical protein VN867_06620 [Candidatus Binataceae bacterium]|nr:hypothetical protein [Candidatus Binataceae bacterium]